MRQQQIISAFSCLSLAAAMACTKTTVKEREIIREVPPTTTAPEAPKSTENQNLVPEANSEKGLVPHATEPSVHFESDLVLPKSALLGKELLFGSDLQYTSKSDGSLDGFPDGFQSQSLAHKLARFEIAGTRLLLVIDDSIDMESDFERTDLAAEFEIVEQTADSLRIRAKVIGNLSMKLFGEQPDNVRPAYVRSLSFDAAGNYLLMETSVYDAKGNIFHYMESAFPRSNLAGGTALIPSEVSESYATLLGRIGTFLASAWVSPENVGSDLSSITKYQRESITRYNIEDGRTIDWYVTSNTPDVVMPEMKAGIEGWNRYFNDFRKDKPVMVFKGKLPAGIKLGDPRYNVVRFDAVASAGAAYESQSFDPLTGIQSHSLIYMPFAWYNLGTAGHVDGIAKSTVAKARSLKLQRQLDKKIVRCVRDMDDLQKGGDTLFLNHSDSEEAGRALMRSTLMHEVGHALGMQHNFNGSLSGEVKNHGTEAWAYSTSVMDYNVPAIEDVALYTDTVTGNERDATKGAVLAYDRQFIDILYNEGKQVAASPSQFPVLAYCDDARADDALLGVDPACGRYDFFGDSREAISTTRARVTSELEMLPSEGGVFVTMKGHMSQIVAASKEEIAAHGQDNPEAVANEMVDAYKKLAQSYSYFLDVSRLSARRAVTINERLLGEWKALLQTDSKGEPLTSESPDAAKLGLLELAQHIPDFIKADKTFSVDAYVAYQKQVRADLLVGIGDAFLSGPAKEGASKWEGVYLAAWNRFESSLNEVGSAALATLTVPELQSAVQDLLTTLKVNAASHASALVTKAQKLMIGGLPAGSVESVEDSATNARPTLSTAVASELLKLSVSLAEKSAADVAVRQLAIDSIASYLLRPSHWDTKLERRDWKNRTSKLLSGLWTELEALRQIERSTGYLTESQRTKFEFLVVAQKTISDAIAGKKSK